MGERRRKERVMEGGGVGGIVLGGRGGCVCVCVGCVCGCGCG